MKKDENGIEKYVSRPIIVGEEIEATLEATLKHEGVLEETAEKYTKTKKSLDKNRKKDPN